MFAIRNRHPASDLGSRDSPELGVGDSGQRGGGRWGCEDWASGSRMARACAGRGPWRTDKSAASLERSFQPSPSRVPLPVTPRVKFAGARDLCFRLREDLLGCKSAMAASTAFAGKWDTLPVNLTPWMYVFFLCLSLVRAELTSTQSRRYPFHGTHSNDACPGIHNSSLHAP